MSLSNVYKLPDKILQGTYNLISISFNRFFFIKKMAALAPPYIGSGEGSDH
jgi:hypothetical protein